MSACEHVFVTSESHTYARFRRALLTKNVHPIDAAARGLAQVSLKDALRILVVLAERRDERFERATGGAAERGRLT
jgi:hypothetical protein